MTPKEFEQYLIIRKKVEAWMIGKAEEYLNKTYPESDCPKFGSRFIGIDFCDGYFVFKTASDTTPPDYFIESITYENLFTTTFYLDESDAL